MKRNIMVRFLTPVLIAGALVSQAHSQVRTGGNETIYRQTAPKINDLVNTKLDVRFDYARQFMYGKAWITLMPHAYATDSLRLDAKGMDIKNISVVNNGKNVPLKYSYDSLQLRINLGKSYKPGEKYIVYIDYTAKPNLLKTKGSAAINRLGFAV